MTIVHFSFLYLTGNDLAAKGVFALTHEYFGGEGDRITEALLEVTKTLSGAAGEGDAAVIGGQVEAHAANAAIDKETEEPEIIVVGYSKNGKKIVYNPADSHATVHLAATPQLWGLVQRILPQTDISGDSMSFETDMGEVIGASECVETDATDEIVYALRPGRHIYMRFTKSREPIPTSIVTTIVRQIPDDPDTYDLFSAWVGPLTPALPGTVRETEESLPFWTSHALVWGKEEVLPESVTTECPW